MMEDGRKLSETKIDAAFAEMALDLDYQSAATCWCLEFESSDWEAQKALDTE